MASSGLPPPPINDAPGSFTWLEWYRQLRSYISTTGSVPWYVIDFAGSNITDIAQRDHNQLQNLQGGTAGEKYHITAAQHASLGVGLHNTLNGIQGGNVNERYHLLQLQYEQVVSNNHNATNNIQGGNTTERYHLTADEHTIATSINNTHGGMRKITDQVIGALGATYIPIKPYDSIIYNTNVNINTNLVDGTFRILKQGNYNLIINLSTTLTPDNNSNRNFHIRLYNITDSIPIPNSEYAIYIGAYSGGSANSTTIGIYLDTNVNKDIRVEVGGGSTFANFTVVSASVAINSVI